MEGWFFISFSFSILLHFIFLHGGKKVRLLIISFITWRNKYIQEHNVCYIKYRKYIL